MSLSMIAMKVKKSEKEMKAGMYKIFFEPYKYHHVTCKYGEDLERLGRILLENYDTFNKVMDLIQHGEIYHLGPSIGKKVGKYEFHRVG